jgi:hypothetical protein
MTVGSVAVPEGTTQSIGAVPGGATIGVAPGSGGSMNVQYRISPNGPLRQWAPGSVTVDTDEATISPYLEMHFTATAADGFAEWNWADPTYP